MMKKIFSLALFLLLPPWSQAAEVKGQAVYKPHEPIILKATDVTSKTAQFLWDITDPAQVKEVGADLHVWAPPGSYTVRLTAVDFEAKKVERATFKFTVSGTPPTPPGPEPGPGPTPPTPTDTPFPGVTGMHVLILLESAEGNELNAEQRAIVRGATVRNYLLNKTPKDATNPNGAFRMWDKDTPTSAAPKVWADALTRAKGKAGFKTPWVMVGNAKSGFEGPLPATASEFLELCKRFEQ
jgi:hypothetical protein